MNSVESGRTAEARATLDSRRDKWCGAGQEMRRARPCPPWRSCLELWFLMLTCLPIKSCCSSFQIANWNTGFLSKYHTRLICCPSKQKAVLFLVLAPLYCRIRQSFCLSTVESANIAVIPPTTVVSLSLILDNYSCLPLSTSDVVQDMSLAQTLSSSKATVWLPPVNKVNFLPQLSSHIRCIPPQPFPHPSNPICQSTADSRLFLPELFPSLFVLPSLLWQRLLFIVCQVGLLSTQRLALLNFRKNSDKHLYLRHKRLG